MHTRKELLEFATRAGSELGMGPQHVQRLLRLAKKYRRLQQAKENRFLSIKEQNQETMIAMDVLAIAATTTDERPTFSDRITIAGITVPA